MFAFDARSRATFDFFAARGRIHESLSYPHINWMSFTPKYTISEATIRDLELISKIDGHLEILRMNPAWADLLEKEAGIKEAVSSIGVEGTVISLKQAKAITGGAKDVVVSERAEREFVGYYESLRFIKANIDERLTLNLLLKIHALVTQGDKKAEPGRVRTIQNAIKSRGKIIYTPPPPDQVGFLLDEFIKWFNETAADKAKSPVMAAAICHFWFVWVHPFVDGNGRVARLLTAFLLLKKKAEGIKYFALSDYYNQNKDAYYDALEKTNICNPKRPSMNFAGDMTLWFTFFISSYLKQGQHIKEVGNRILQINLRVERLRKESAITSNHEKVLSFLGSRERASYKELVKLLGVTRPRVHQILNPLRKAHILIEERIGPEIWFAIGSPEEEPDETVFKKKLYGRSKVLVAKRIKQNMGTQGVLPLFESWS
jgi:Fic family protein